MAAVRSGVGRETAHEAIKEHAVAVALAMRETGAAQRPARPAGRGRAAAGSAATSSRPWSPPDRADRHRRAQVATLVAAVGEIAAAHPEAAGYQPGAIL